MKLEEEMLKLLFANINYVYDIFVFDLPFFIIDLIYALVLI